MWSMVLWPGVAVNNKDEGQKAKSLYGHVSEMEAGLGPLLWAVRTRYGRVLVDKYRCLYKLRGLLT